MNSFHQPVARGAARLRPAFIAMLCLAATAAAQVRSTDDRRRADDDQPPQVDARLEQVPMRIEALGLTMHPPAGANVTAQRANGRVTVAVAEPIANPRWSITLQLLDSSLEQPTPSAQVDEHLKALDARGTPYTVITNEPVEINDVVGQLCYLKQTTSAGQDYVTGWLIVPAGRKVFLVAQVLTMPDYLDDFRPLLEASFDTIEITSQEELSLRIRSRIEAGRTFLEQLTPGLIRQAAQNAPTQWRRIYRPADPESNEPEQEIGYMVIEIFPGKRGLLNPYRSELEAGEHEVGLFTRINVRVLEGRDLRDVEMNYWMAWDQGEEAFTVRGTRRQGDASVSEAITGVRTRRKPGNLEPTLTVISTDEFTRDRDTKEWRVPEVYLSQALNWLLPFVLPREQSPDGRDHSYSYYYFDMAQAKPSLVRRVDAWQPVEASSGRWQLTTRMGTAGEPLVSTYDTHGLLIRREHPDGAVTEPIELSELRRLWQRKNLPLNTDELERNRRR